MKKESRFVLRAEQSLMNKIKKEVSKYIGAFSINTWILHAIQEKLEREKNANR